MVKEDTPHWSRITYHIKFNQTFMRYGPACLNCLSSLAPASFNQGTIIMWKHSASVEAPLGTSDLVEVWWLSVKYHRRWLSLFLARKFGWNEDELPCGKMRREGGPIGLPTARRDCRRGESCHVPYPRSFKRRRCLGGYCEEWEPIY